MSDNGKMTVVVVHGIGKSKPGYAAPLIDGIRREFNGRLQKQDPAAGGDMDPLQFVEIVWDDLISDNQQRLAQRLRAGLPAPNKQGVFAKIFRPLLAPFKKGINWLRTDVAAEYVNDIISYGNDEIYAKIHQRIQAEINAAAGSGPDKRPLTIIAHSLGSVICSDFIYDQIKNKGEFHPRFTLANFFTLGSPLALFALRYGPEAFASPIKVEAAHGQWINIFDRDDPFAYPLKPLNDAYHEAIEQDAEVDTGAFGFAHVKYWKNRATQWVIATKLAADYRQTT